MSNTDLIARLRHGAAPLSDPDLNDEAADALEAQAHQLRAAKTIIAGLDDRAVLLAGEYSSCRAQVHDIAGERAANAALTDENEALRADAMRYRWLLEHAGFGIRRNGVHELSFAFYIKQPNHINELSACIDAARAIEAAHGIGKAVTP